LNFIRTFLREVGTFVSKRFLEQTPSSDLTLTDGSDVLGQKAPGSGLSECGSSPWPFPTIVGADGSVPEVDFGEQYRPGSDHRQHLSENQRT